MKTILSSETMDIPEGVKITVKAKVIEVEGPRGTLTRNFKHLNLDFQLIKDAETGQKKLKIESWFGSRKSTAAIRTALSHVDNLIKGVTKGYRYKMRFVLCLDGETNFDAQVVFVVWFRRRQSREKKVTEAMGGSWWRSDSLSSLL
ncbi:hypothetical protein RHGRI_006322 [Rhododendron griersonianum]|uniref:Large ribosomal subunit protein uL6 alpha-beta domain-containing protein n=1 Tax=Rhododendron griersonianum TaxID=479676 RepID=A0AAV6KT86_9ERIC|nr:hypothetical protein RHGRI_006322 [Rhododendron griersonianum]